MPDPRKKEEFQRRQTPLIEALFKAIGASVPRAWRMAVLELDVETTQPGRAFTINHRLRNPSNRTGIAKLPQALMMAAGQVHSLFHEYHRRWVQATFTFVFESGQKGPRLVLLTEAHFEYPPPQSHTTLLSNN